MDRDRLMGAATGYTDLAGFKRSDLVSKAPGTYFASDYDSEDLVLFKVRHWDEVLSPQQKGGLTVAAKAKHAVRVDTIAIKVLPGVPDRALLSHARGKDISYVS
jgi:hypothetical protein